MTLASIFSLSDIPGHLSYLLLAISYVMTNIFLLRVIACLGLVLEIVYFALSGGNLATGIVWDVVFVAINLWQLWRLSRDRFSGGMTDEERLALVPLSALLDRAQVMRLVKAGRYVEYAPGETLTRAGQRVSDLSFVVSGRFDILIGGRLVASIARAGFVGEIAYATGAPATADAIAAEPSRVLSISHEAVRALSAADDQIAAALHRLISDDLARKLVQSNAPAMAQIAPVTA